MNSFYIWAGNLPWVNQKGRTEIILRMLVRLSIQLNVCFDLDNIVISKAGICPLFCGKRYGQIC